MQLAPIHSRTVLGAAWCGPAIVVASTTSELSVTEPIEVSAARYTGTGRADELRVTLSVRHANQQPTKPLVLLLDVVPIDETLFSFEDSASTIPAGFASPSIQPVGTTVRFAFPALGTLQAGADLELDVVLTLAHDAAPARPDVVGSAVAAAS